MVNTIYNEWKLAQFTVYGRHIFNIFIYLYDNKIVNTIW